VRKLFNVIRVDSERTRTLSPDSLFQLTDLQVAAFVWYLQVDTYLRLLDHFLMPASRHWIVRRFLRNPWRR